MRLLLDTHVLLLWLAEDTTLAEEVLRAIADPGSEVFVSAASVWEVAIKASLGKLEAPSDLLQALQEEGLTELPITAKHAYMAGMLPRHHNDPFDRVLVAQAFEEGLTFVTRGSWAAPYGVPMLRA